MMTKEADLKLQLDDISTSYIDLGTGAVPLIFVHGFPFDKESWSEQMDTLRNFTRVISYDLRGFGSSDLGSREITIDLFADDLIRLMDTLNIEKAVVCGLSMGGYIVLNAISRYPERFEALILSDTQCIADSAESKQKRYDDIKIIEEQGLEQYAEAFVNKIFSKESFINRVNIQAISTTESVIKNTNPQSVTSTLKALAERQGACSLLQDIHVPTLILCGTDDEVTPIIQSQYLSDHIPNATFHTIEDAGHVPNVEKPDIFNRYVAEFIGKFKLLNPII